MFRGSTTAEMPLRPNVTNAANSGAPKKSNDQRHQLKRGNSTSVAGSNARFNQTSQQSTRNMNSNSLTSLANSKTTHMNGTHSSASAKKIEPFYQGNDSIFEQVPALLSNPTK